jgi:hypothetical protein
MGFRAFPLDGKLLRFDRTTGENQLWTGDETATLRQRAPRVLQVAITNVCNKSCAFCYRPMDAESAWTFDDLLALARVADRWGVLELAFGGGEPTVFPRFAELVRAVWTETGLCPSFTTNGSRLTPALLRSLRGSYGQIQLSIYDDDDYHAVIELLAAERARFGLNYLVTPARLPTLEADVAAFAARGVRDILLLSYKGRDPALHLTPAQQARFDEGVARLHRVLSIASPTDVGRAAALQAVRRSIASPTDVGRAAAPQAVRRSIASPTDVGRAAAPQAVRRSIASPTDLGRAAAPQAVRRSIDLKVDVCWGERLHHTPRLFEDGDCGAGSLFLSITSDRRVLACSFADDGPRLTSPEELPRIWAELRAARPAAPKPGCARLPAFGLANTSLRVVQAKE